jgi:TM2 domain-containing membrane protein YozV
VGKQFRCPKCQSVFVPQVKPNNVASSPSFQLDEDVDVSKYASPNTKYCHHCGVKIAALAEICPKCGVRQPGHAARPGQSPGDSPNKVVACLLAIFLGLFGAHRFYLGQTMWGLFYLLMNVLLFLTVVVPFVFAVICLIEGIVYLTYSDSDFAEKYARE